MSALVALILVLVGFALGVALAYFALNRQVHELQRRIDQLVRSAQSAAVEPPPPIEPTAIASVVLEATVTRAQMPAPPEDGRAEDRETARMPAFRTETIKSLDAQTVPLPAAPSASAETLLPGSLVAPPIPGMTPADELPSPHSAHTGPVSLPPAPLPIAPPPPTNSNVTVPPVTAARRPTALPKPGLPAAMPAAQERRTGLPAPQGRNSTAPSPRPDLGKRVEPARLIENQAVARDPATNVGAYQPPPPPSNAVVRRSFGPPEPQARVESPRVEPPRTADPARTVRPMESVEIPRYSSSPRDSTLPMSLDGPKKAPRQRDDDEVTQLDPLDSEVMARLQRPPNAVPNIQPLPPPRAESSAVKRAFDEPPLPARVTAGGGVVRGKDAHTNVLHIEENNWPDVGQAAGGWDIDNLLGDFAREVHRQDNTPIDPGAGDDDKGA